MNYALCILEVPLGSYCRIHEERFVVVGVVDEVAAYLYLRAEAEVRIEIIPELWLGEYYQLSVAVCFLATPEIDES